MRSNPVGLLILAACLAMPACRVNAPTPIERATMLTRRGEEAEAARVLREHLKEKPSSVEARRLLIRVLALSGNLADVQAEAEALAEVVGPTSPVPWIEMGHAYELNHGYDKALAMYDRAAEVAPEDPAGPRSGGMRAARWGEVELAAPRLEEALRRDPSDAVVWHAFGLVLVHLGDLEGATRAYESGLRADPAALENRLGLATVAVRREDPKTALRHYDAILTRRPKFADGYLGRSWALMELGRFDDAERALDRAVRLGADRAAAGRQLRELWRRRNGGRERPPSAQQSE